MLLELDAGEHDDEPDELWRLVDILAIACGGHAGDDASMARVIAACPSQQLGAHPSYPDRANFGRVAMAISLATLEAAIADQCAHLSRIATDHGRTIQWIKPHGALYHAAADDEAIARAVLRGASWSLGDAITVIGPPPASAVEPTRRSPIKLRADPTPHPDAPMEPSAGASLGFATAGLTGIDVPVRGALAAVAAELGLRYVREGFADRRMRRDGSLVPRGEPDALITDPAEAAAQAKQLSGVDIVAVHADTPNALAIARAVRAALS
jgi:UPF0271 protein